MKSLPTCPPDRLLINTTTTFLSFLQLMLILLSSPDSSSLPDVFSLIDCLIFFRVRKAFVVKLMLLHLISVGSRMNYRSEPKSH